jgi:NADH-quinone oxidoreductase subunit A
VQIRASIREVKHCETSMTGLSEHTADAAKCGEKQAFPACVGPLAGLTQARGPDAVRKPLRVSAEMPQASSCCDAIDVALRCTAGAGTMARGCRPKGAGSRKGKQMEALLAAYMPIIVFVGLCLFIGIVLLITPFIVAYKSPDPEKLSAYECGFNAFDDARMKFDVRFYLVAILFIIFDLEVAFLFPWAVSFGTLGWFGYGSMMLFLFVLTIGFIYEWKKGALEWD